MDVDVVPGSVTDWTVTIDDQRRLKRALVGLRLRSRPYWVLTLGLPVLLTGALWFGMHDPGLGPGLVGEAVELGMMAAIGVVFLAFSLTTPLRTVSRRVEREFPVGATLVAWATESGLGMRTLRRLAFYPWSGLTQVEVGPVLVRCRQGGPKALAVPAYLPAGPDEVARSIDFPAQLIGPAIRRELAARAGRESRETPMLGEPIVVDRALRWRLVRAWLRAQFGITAWLLPAVFALNILLLLAGGSYRMAIFWLVLVLLNPLIWLLSGEGRMSGMYAVGGTVVGSMGEWLEIQGPWGSVAWPSGWLKLRRMTKHTVTYEMVQVRPDGLPASLTDAEKRIVVIPRAFLDTPTPAVSAEV
ncbi:hypothetical protein SAMN05428985_102223 [Nocardioides sp. YR527]|uniref:hypothetical protein n=1 Tax=Nocardioides sp. YR527 TaxID=1881028 RepID=UPI0008804A40|nr:hypothetical protein [Nocardioides sp. YR527]SDK00338.1 hypothetical protein SAMN05428985_102223 [Nocardioides sp. YR527]